jgi:hypothetical protein
VFPLNLGVVKLSGSGNDALFLGVARPVDEDKHVIKVRGVVGEDEGLRVTLLRLALFLPVSLLLKTGSVQR